ncbi:hypothetical protein HDV62DRAFT_367612 [Trichoderma sp. SZMC 28011]
MMIVLGSLCYICASVPLVAAAAVHYRLVVKFLVDRKTIGRISSPTKLFQCNSVKEKPMTFCSDLLSLLQVDSNQVRKKFRTDCCAFGSAIEDAKQTCKK